MDLGEMLSNFLSDVTAALPAIIAAIIVVIIGYVVGKVLGNAVNKVIEKMGIEKSFDETDTGKSFRNACNSKKLSKREVRGSYLFGSTGSL